MLKYHEANAVRSSAEKALAKLSASKEQVVNADVAFLLSKLKDCNPKVRSSAEVTLSKLGASKEQIFNGYMTAVSEGQNANARINAVNKLGDLGDKRAIEPLLRMLEDRDCYTFVETALAKLRASKEEMADAYSMATSSKNWEAKKNAEKKLVDLGDKRAIWTLLGMLNDKDKGVRNNAVKKIVNLGDKSAIEALLGMLKDEDNDVRSSAEAALAKLGAGREQLVDGYIAVLSFKNSFYGRGKANENAVRKLESLGDKRAIEPLLEVLKDPYLYDDSGIALIKLGASKEQILNGHIAALLLGRGNDARINAAKKLTDLGDKSAIEPLLGTLKDEDNDVRSSAEAALAKQEQAENKWSMHIL